MAQRARVYSLAFAMCALVFGCKKSQAICGEDASAAPIAIPLDQPAKPSTGSAEVQTVVRVTLLVDGSILLNGKKVTVDELRSELSTLRQNNPELRATIEADGDVPHKKVIYILDVLKQVGVTKISFAVAPAAPLTR